MIYEVSEWGSSDKHFIEASSTSEAFKLARKLLGKKGYVLKKIPSYSIVEKERMEG
ncbi:hypothetical protein UFOVP1244_127 [uncultured Caudovirales phage]|uniref:Uncharacterized protein n=1 Tax=uncultured Caudovirales phage TaxID=2100421 RepID=A0A6J5RF21_9CAUD|nr:hypothetical protein UFOVP1244_127 [uncultured Caudovirales phage]